MQRFDTVASRFDGSAFWFEELDPRHDPAAATFLRAALADRVPPEQLERKGLTAEQRAAYELNYWELIQPSAEDEDPSEPQLNPNLVAEAADNRNFPPKTELSVLGYKRISAMPGAARLIDYLERGESFRVTYLVGATLHLVRKQAGPLRPSGWNLPERRGPEVRSRQPGGSMLHEAEDGRGMVRVGNDNAGMAEEQYWACASAKKTVVERCWVLVDGRARRRFLACAPRATDQGRTGQRCIRRLLGARPRRKTMLTSSVFITRIQAARRRQATAI